MDSSPRLSIASDSFTRSLRQRRLQSGVPKTAGGTPSTLSSPPGPADSGVAVGRAAPSRGRSGRAGRGRAGGPLVGTAMRYEHDGHHEQPNAIALQRLDKALEVGHPVFEHVDEQLDRFPVLERPAVPFSQPNSAPAL